MMKQILMMTCILALSLPLGLTGCNQAESENLEQTLAKTKFEKDVLEIKMQELTRKSNELTRKSEELQKQVKVLTESRDRLQAELAELDKLQKQVDEVTMSRARLQEKNDELEQKLQTGTQKVSVLEEQLEQVQAAIVELQGTIKL